MTVRLPSPRSLLVGAALVATGFALAWAMPEAEAAKEPTVVCTQIQQSATQVNEAMVAEFMSEQIVAGRARFQTVRGLSTVLCAY
jgi:hypothetical protein